MMRSCSPLYMLRLGRETLMAKFDLQAVPEEGSTKSRNEEMRNGKWKWRNEEMKKELRKSK